MVTLIAYYGRPQTYIGLRHDVLNSIVVAGIWSLYKAAQFYGSIHV